MRTTPLRLTALLVSLLCAGCQALGPDSEWTQLLDGNTLEHWRGHRRPDVPAGWVLTDGVLAFTPGIDGGDLITRDEFDDFELRLEWKISANGNSGIFFHVSEDYEQTYETGPEMQVLDNAVLGDSGDPRTSAGGNYALHAPRRDAAAPVGEWNRVRITVHGDRVEHWLNDVLVVSYRLWTAEWSALVAASKFIDMPGYGIQRKGHIALQDHGNRVWYRNARIRRF